eukprot:snap_masked-scaffold277_size226016-processed-gene-1.8 protein:Tk10752 transcript:snap_masked-scaffold277_size226016-processed-gene-1.8-mRNA-1 annotation:"serine threonine-protein"
MPSLDVANHSHSNSSEDEQPASFGDDLVVPPLDHRTTRTSTSSAYSSASSETIRSQTMTSEAVFLAPEQAEDSKSGTTAPPRDGEEVGRMDEGNSIAFAEVPSSLSFVVSDQATSLFHCAESDLPPTSPTRTNRAVPLTLSEEASPVQVLTPYSRRKGLPPTASRGSRPNSFRSPSFRRSGGEASHAAASATTNSPSSSDGTPLVGTAEHGTNGKRTLSPSFSPPALIPSALDQTHHPTTPTIPRRSSFRDPATLSKVSSPKQQERRGSLKSFASSILDRKGSFRNILGNSSSRWRGSSDSLFPRRSTSSQRLSKSVVAKSSPNVSGKEGEHSEKRGSFRTRKGPPPSAPQSPHKKDSGISIGEGSPVYRESLVEPAMTRPRTTSKIRGLGTSGGSVSTESTGTFDFDTSLSSGVPGPNMKLSTSGDLSHSIKRLDVDKEYDIVQKIGEGWFSRVYLAEHRDTRQEIVLKAINSKTVSADDFWREYQHSYLLSAHINVLTIFDVVFQSNGYYMFATEYAPLGDLTSNVSDRGIGEMCAKRVGRQIGSALEWVHSKKLCHLDVKLDNILVFKSDFSWVKLCDFGAVRSQGDIVIKKNELLPYCPPELVAKHANEYYQVDRVQDIFQFGIVLFFCLFGILPWQRADVTDPNFAEFFAWRHKKTSKPPKNFKPMTSRSQKLFRKLMDVDPTKRLPLHELPKYTDDKWLKKVPKSSLNGAGCDPKQLSDGISQLTMGSFQSVHSNAVEKNKILYTLLQHGVETTVDRSQKNSRIINWIQHGQATNEEQLTPTHHPTSPQH